MENDEMEDDEDSLSEVSYEEETVQESVHEVVDAKLASFADGLQQHTALMERSIQNNNETMKAEMQNMLMSFMQQMGVQPQAPVPDTAQS